MFKQCLSGTGTYMATSVIQKANARLLPWACLQFVIVVFPDHTHLLFSFNTERGFFLNLTAKKRLVMTLISVILIMHDIVA